MATRYWIGVNTNLTDTVNWSASDGGAGSAGVPGAGDTAWFTRGTTVPATNLSGIVELANLYITPGFCEGAVGKTFGLEGTPITVEISGTIRINNPALAGVYLASPGATDLIATLYIESLPNGSVYVRSGGVTAFLVGSDCRYFDFATDVDLTTLMSGGASGILRACPTSPASLVLSNSRGSIIEVQRLVKTISAGGVVRLTEEGYTNVSGFSAVVEAGGRLELSQRGGAIGNAATEYIQVKNGGELSSRGALVPFTFTASVAKSAGAIVDIPPSSVAAVPTVAELGGSPL